MNKIITRFAPSPSGNLHIGSVRTALINFIVTQQAKKFFSDSKFLLRIEDTDLKRSKDEFKNNIIKGLKWLEIEYDEDPFIQSENFNRHKEIAYELLNKNKAYKCICTSETLQRKREENLKNKNNIKRLCVACENDQGVQSLTENYTIRIKIPNEGETSIKDLVQGNIKIQNKELDNYILLRENGIPTYMLSVVVDDYDVGVNMIIRGDDHLNNAFRQFYIYKNMGWEIPNYAHIPLIHGEDGKKLSKRHGSVDINEFKKNGYLKESLINNLILLGWSPSSKNEIIELEEIIEKFNLKKLSKSSSIFNYNKLNFFNNYFIQKDINNHKIFLYSNENLNLKKFIDFDRDKFIKIYNIYKKNLNYFSDLEEICSIYYNANYQTNKNELLNPDYNLILKKFYSEIKNLEIWDLDNLDSTIKNFIDKNNIKFSEFGKPIRLIFTNLIKGPSISNILYILGKNNSIKRIENYIGN